MVNLKYCKMSLVRDLIGCRSHNRHCLSLCISVCLSVGLYVCMSVFICLFCFSVSVCLSDYLALSVCLSVYYIYIQTTFIVNIRRVLLYIATSSNSCFYIKVQRCELLPAMVRNLQVVSWLPKRGKS